MQTRPRSIRLVRAILGMLLALLLAVTIVTLEFHAHRGRPAAHRQDRIAQLQSRIAALQQRVVAANRSLVSMAAELNAEREFNQLLAVPDSRLLRFTSSRPNLTAIMALNPRLMTAALEASAPLPAEALQLWWIQRRQPPLRGPVIDFDAHGRAHATLRLPLPSDQLDAIALTAQSDDERAAIAHPQLRTQLNASRR